MACSYIITVSRTRQKSFSGGVGASDQYALSEVAGTITWAECLNYMAMIALEEGNDDEPVFYAEQSAPLTSELGKKVKNAILFQIEGYACSLLGEYYLNIRNKEKALQYAETGLSACEEWQGTEAHNGQPALVPLMEKFRNEFFSSGDLCKVFLALTFSSSGKLFEVGAELTVNKSGRHGICNLPATLRSGECL